MAAIRALKDMLAYKKYLENYTPAAGCPFCEITAGHEQYVGESAHFLIIKNRFPYAAWDGLPVVEHLMIIPKAHVESLADLPEHTRAEYVDLLGHYEIGGYSSYTRHRGSSERTITHLHTHILKLDHRHAKTGKRPTRSSKITAVRHLFSR